MLSSTRLKVYHGSGEQQQASFAADRAEASKHGWEPVGHEQLVDSLRVSYQQMPVERKGPFGLWMGMTLAQVGAPSQELSSGKYRFDVLPRPHSAFEYYILQITSRFGLSWVKAVGSSIRTSAYGYELVSAYDAMEKRLAASYGPSERIDFLMAGSIWDEPRDWMQAVASQERVLMTMWKGTSGATLRDSLASVALVIGAPDADEGYIAVEYAFENSDAADAALEAAEDWSL